MAKEISNIIYRHSLEYAIEHGEVEQYKALRKLDIECKEAIEKAIRQNFNGLYLNYEAAKTVTENYSTERIEFVLANTIQHQSWDGRFSNDNKAWAAALKVPENILHGMDMNGELVVRIHPAVLDEFVNLFREEIMKKEQKSIFGIYMCDEKLYFQNTSGLDAKELCRAYAACDKPFIEMEQYGKQISEAEFAAIQQGEKLNFSVEFDADNDNISIFDGIKSENREISSEDMMLWKIAAYIHKKYPEYKFFIRIQQKKLHKQRKLQVELKESPVNIYKSYDVLNETTINVVKDVDSFVNSCNYGSKYEYSGCCPNNGAAVRVTSEVESAKMERYRKHSIFSIEMYGEKIFFESTIGLDAAKLLELYKECEEPFIEMEQCGKQISEAEFAAIQQGENFWFSVEFNADNDEVTIFDGEHCEYRQLSEQKEIQEFSRAGRGR